MTRKIRLAQKEDYPAILDILNQAIAERKFTALLTPATLKKRREWFCEHEDGRHPIYICEEDGEVIGWMAISSYRDGREGFANTCEISYYVDSDKRGSGVATMLLEHVLEASKAFGIKNLMAVIFEDNRSSRKLVEKYGFQIWGRFPNIVEIDGTEKDCLQYGKHL